MSIWKIKSAQEGKFEVENPHKIDNLYFPLTNTSGLLFSCISPFLTGDIKTSVNNYLTYPTTIYDLKSIFCARTLWLRFSPHKVVNVSPLFSSLRYTKIEAAPLYHCFTTEIEGVVLKIINFIPEDLPVEVMKITLKNLDLPREVEPIFCIPLFCRSVDNLFNHRHVTSLLMRIFRHEWGISVKPTMCFDETGHRKNENTYFVYGFRDEGIKPKEVVATLEEFIGEEGSLLNPEYVFGEGKLNSPDFIEGKEPLCGLNFGKIKLKKREETTFYILMGVTPKEELFIFKRLSSPLKIEESFKESKLAWGKIYHQFDFNTADSKFDFWVKWVNIQPTLRKLFGCSFLPHFDYGRGGRGWRDLWQDLLTLLLVAPRKVREELVNNFRGVRIDGSNATIITSQGGFIADRNRISRVWMDHGVWPYLTLKLYLDQTADLDILWEEVEFFRDHQLKRAKEIDYSFFYHQQKDNLLRDERAKVYTSSLIEHLLIQNLVPFFNVGKHGNILLENGDWNDGLDMAGEQGESVTFSFMYAFNLKEIGKLLEELKIRKEREEIEITEELLTLIDTAGHPIDYSDVESKKALLKEYLEKTKYCVKGKKVKIKIDILSEDLRRKSQWLQDHLRKNEWIEEIGIFNGYYDNKGRRVEGKIGDSIRVMLTSQVFSIMSEVATSYHIKRIYNAISCYLKEPRYNTFRLNTNFGEVKWDLGRAFGFSYGDKENGAIFSHIDVMLAFSLYKQGWVKEGFDLVSSMFKLATSGEAKVYPCIPEYFNAQYRGMYPYLTGSASWLILLIITQMFGIRKVWTDLVIEPKLRLTQFRPSDSLSILKLSWDSKECIFSFKNVHCKDWPDYCIGKVIVNGKKVFEGKSKSLRLSSQMLEELLDKKVNQIEVVLV
ncbi:MAG: hypothetical protein B6D56_03830 [Candidatus Omnitrophica bacterium 4484_70.1]|nr:MAG: hypothetical protein B6D56_03830 [Candidatus Omnitrophica bacterium 4484_70.1]